MKFVTQTLAICFCLILTAGSAQAVSWIGGVGGAWEIGLNWQGGVVPVGGDLAVIQGSEGAVVGNGVTAEMWRMNVGSAAGGDSFVTIESGGSLTLGVLPDTGAGARLRMIWGGDGGPSTSTVNVQGGTLVAPEGVQVWSGATIAPGDDAVFNVTAGGTATISAGSFNFTSSGTGGRTILVDGAGSSLTVSGQTLLNGTTPGTLTISNGGTFTTGSGTITGVVGGAGGTFVQDGVGTNHP